MSDYGFNVTLTEQFEPVAVRTREALAKQGFGILTEIDVAATMKAKLDVDMAPYLILGACNPPLAHQAIGIDASIGLLLPYNVVVRALDERRTLVEVMDPNVMVSASGNTDLAPVAEQARTRLTAVLDTLSGPAPVAQCV